MRGRRGISSVFVAVVLTVFLLVLLFIIIDTIYLYTAKELKIRWEGEMGVYQPPVPVTSLSSSTWPVLDGYCLVNNVNGIIYYSCPSTP